MDLARCSAIQKAENELYQRAFDRSDPKSITALIMWGKNFAHWQDRHQVEHSGTIETRSDFLAELVSFGQIGAVASVPAKAQ